ncbi:MAG: hypothetical protein IT349_11080 [Candidatus Eisenbacteria bacterium]|nr:hypothetical protein [Candidatus Eisenbacteria bacterium]
MRHRIVITALIWGCFAASQVEAVLLVPEEFQTLQAGVTAASPGDTISVAAGVYQGTGNRGLQLTGDDLVLLSRDGPGAVTIDCGGADRAMEIGNAFGHVSVDGLEFTNGLGDLGGAVLAGAVTCTFRNCRFYRNRATLRGGAVHAAWITQFIDCVIVDNEEHSQGGGGVSGGWGDVSLVRCLLTGNRSFGGTGGAIYSDAAVVSLTSCTVATNYASSGGGAIFNFSADVYLKDTICTGNCAANYADEIYTNATVHAECTDLDVSQVLADEILVQDAFFSDPLFCDAAYCFQPTGNRKYDLHDGSPCLPDGNACGVLIGALGRGCGALPAVGACCLANAACIVVLEQECVDYSGSYQGDGTGCDPNPCVPVAIESTSWGRLKARYAERSR